MQSAGIIIGFDRPQRGHNILAHGSAVGVGGGMSFCVGVVWPPMSSRQSLATRDLTRAQDFEPLRRRVTPAGVITTCVNRASAIAPEGRRQNSPWQRRGCWRGMGISRRINHVHPHRIPTMCKQRYTGRTRGSAPTPSRHCRPRPDPRDNAKRREYDWN